MMPVALSLVPHATRSRHPRAVCLENRTVLSYGELAELTGEFERALHHDVGLTDLGYRTAAEPAAGTAIFRQKSQLAGQIYVDTALLLATSGPAGSPRAVRLSCSGLAASTAHASLTGRASRIVKVPGVRTSLDDLERTVERPG